MRASAVGHQAGVSLVELLVGLTIGLVITGAGLTALVAHLRESRALIAQSRLMQDLRATTDLIARDLRRAGYWGDAGSGVWQRGSAATAAANPYAALATTDAPITSISLRYSRDTVENGVLDSNEQFGFRLRNGALEAQLGAAPWQTLTDATSMRITRFSLVPTAQTITLEGTCHAPCPAASSTCPPQLRVRGLTVTVSAEGVAPTTPERTVRTQVRLRNDEITGQCPA